MNTEVDLLILGGGAAGLNLALQIAEGGGSGLHKTILLEKRTTYENDRTWSFWSECAPEFKSTAHRTFTQLRVRDPSSAAVATLDCSERPYHVLPSDVFYAEALRRIRDGKNVSLVLGMEVTEAPVKMGNFWKVKTNEKTYSAKFIVDTRPSRLSGECREGLFQSFYGIEIECEQDIFDVVHLDLMDFEEHPHFAIGFTYVIPFSVTRALIEFTVFAPAALSRTDLRVAVEGAIARRTMGVKYTRLREESGILPMGTPRGPASSDPTYIKVGVQSGAARASTGYAFQRIQQWAVRCAKELECGRAPIPHSPDPWFIRWMDRLFISVLRSRPSLAPRLFVKLFGTVQPLSLIRFLSGDATIIDCLKVIFALPFRPFLTELPRVIGAQNE